MQFGINELAKQFVRGQLEALEWQIVRRSANNAPAIPLLRFWRLAR
jgi:hypothetical protein